jgi:hypothetical protein
MVDNGGVAGDCKPTYANGTCIMVMIMGGAGAGLMLPIGLPPFDTSTTRDERTDGFNNIFIRSSSRLYSK